MFSEIDIEKLKSKLKDYSKDYKENFNQIEKYIKSEIDEISKLKASKKSIIPEISFNQINQRNTKFVESIKKRGCVIVRDVFENLMIERLNIDLEEYIEENNYYDDQKKKSGLDKYFSDLKSSKPQIMGLYWSKAQMEIRHSENMLKVKKWLNNLWIYKNDEYDVFDPSNILSTRPIPGPINLLRFARA